MNSESINKKEIRIIPEDWEVLTLGDVCSNISETYNLKNKNQIFFLNTSDIFDGKVTNKNLFEVESLPGQAKKKICKDDILFSEIRPINRRFALVDFNAEEYVVSTKLMVLRANDKVLPEFLFQFLKSPIILNYFQGLAESRSGTFPQITFDTIKHTEILTLPKFLQKTIVNQIQSIDHKIEINNKMTQTLEKIGQALFKHWFIDFEFPDDGKPYKSRGGEIVDSELGKIPKGWRINKLRDLVSYYIGGGWGQEESKQGFTKEAYVIRGTDIPNVSKGDISTCPFRFHKPTNYNSREINIHDIIFEVSGGSKGQPVGRSLLIEDKTLERMQNVICASFCKLIRPNKDKVSPYLLDLLFKSLYNSEKIMEYQTQSTGITNFHFEYFLDDIHLAIPDKDLMDKFHFLVQPLYQQRARLGYENYLLSEIRDSLLPRLMSGKIRVTETIIDNQYPSETLEALE